MIKFREAVKPITNAVRDAKYYGKNPKKFLQVKVPAELRRAKESPFKTLGTLSGPAVTGGLISVNPTLGAIPGTTEIASGVGRKVGSMIDKKLGLGKRIRAPRVLHHAS